MGLSTFRFGDIAGDDPSRASPPSRYHSAQVRSPRYVDVRKVREWTPYSACR
jgi:hypothetical protein